MTSNKIEFVSKPKDGEPWDVILIGSGPASLTAAIYTTRGAASTLILGGEPWGGQLILTSEVDNFPGFPKGILGPELMMRMRQQAERFGAEFVEEKVIGVDFSKRPLKVKTATKEYLAKSVIVATGAETKWLGVPGEDALRGRGISSCAPCDAPFFKGRKVAVVGGGDSAMEEALVLTKYATEVYILHRREEFRASAIMQKKVLANPKIKILWNTEVVKFLGQDKLEKAVFKDSQKGTTKEFPVDGVFVAIGHTPMTEMLNDQIELNEKGYAKRMVNGYQTAASVPGVFLAGDVHDHRYKQAVTAAGFGCMAALDCLKFLDEVQEKNAQGI